MNYYSTYVDESSPHFPVEQIVIERLKIGMQQTLSPEVFADADIEVLFDLLRRQFLVQARGFIWHKQIDRLDIKYPKNWKEAFKERWFPEWALERWPIKYTEHAYDVAALYPDLHKKYAIPNTRQRFVFLRPISNY